MYPLNFLSESTVETIIKYIVKSLKISIKASSALLLTYANGIVIHIARKKNSTTLESLFSLSLISFLINFNKIINNNIEPKISSSLRDFNTGNRDDGWAKNIIVYTTRP